MNIAIVGGGPVGLTTAIKLIYNKPYEKKEYNTDYIIDIYEKRKKYTREQFIVSGGTKGNLLINYPHDLQKILKNNFSCYIDNPVVDMYGFCFKNNPDINTFSQTIEIKKLEKILYEYIKKNYKNKINIIHSEFTKNDIEKYNIIIGADGQKSQIRENFIKCKFKEIKDYKAYILHIKYTDLSNKKYKISNNKLSINLKKAFKLKLKRNNYDNYNLERGTDKKQYFEQDRFRLIRSDTNKTQFLLQINKTTYNKIKNIKTFKNLPTKVQNIVLINSFIMNSYPINLKNVSINVYNTVVGHSEKFSIVKNKKLYVLIGDSAMTTHVFTGEGLNINFNLIKNLINDFINNDKPRAIKRYNDYMKNRFKSIIYYKALLRYIPHKLLKNTCSKITLDEILEFLNRELDFYYINNNNFYNNIYNEKINDLKNKYKNISDNEIKNELCFILRDKILKYYTYKLNKK